MSGNRATHLVIGTAGHIDHGKSTLVHTLTGTDPDRLREEKERGITIELGFAFYGTEAAFVDVPGHEKLIKTMVAGASAMQAAMLVVAVDDGVMPQTREHLAVLDALGISQGIVVLTKAELAESEDWIELVREEVRELLAPTTLAGSPIIVTDAVAGRGIEELHSALKSMIESAGEPDDPGFFRMPVDRSFLIKGHGRVVTGTVWSGSAAPGDRLRLLPAGVEARLRGTQAHGETVPLVRIHDRAALNLQVDGEPDRGDVLCTPGRGTVTDFLDVEIRLLPGARVVEHRQRIRLHLGTAEAMGRLLIVGGDMIAPGERGFARVALESKMSAMWSDRGVVRLYSPLETLGGVRVLDPRSPDRRRTLAGLTARLEALAGTAQQALTAWIAARGGITRDDLLEVFPLSADQLAAVLEALVSAGQIVLPDCSGQWVVDGGQWHAAHDRTLEVVELYHRQHPEEFGMPKGEWIDRLRGTWPTELVNARLEQMVAAGEVSLDSGRLALPDHKARLKPKDEKDAASVLEVLRREGLNAPLPATIAEELSLAEERVRGLLRSLKQVGQAVILAENVVVEHTVYEQAKHKLVSAYDDGRTVVVGDAAKLLGTSRKYVIPLLEALDREGVTQREGDVRKVVARINDI